MIPASERVNKRSRANYLCFLLPQFLVPSPGTQFKLTQLLKNYLRYQWISSWRMRLVPRTWQTPRTLPKAGIWATVWGQWPACRVPAGSQSPFSTYLQEWYLFNNSSKTAWLCAALAVFASEWAYLSFHLASSAGSQAPSTPFIFNVVHHAVLWKQTEATLLLRTHLV